MKTKLFSLFIAVFLFSFGGNAQTEPVCTDAKGYPCITLIGAGIGGWTKEAEKTMQTEDGVVYTLVDVIVTKGGPSLNSGELKFREGRCWEDKCPSSVTNTFGWGPPKAVPPAEQSTGWPSGSNTSPQKNGPNIQGETGVWNVTFNRTNGSWEFIPGTPLPVISLVGSAVTGSPVAMSSEDGVIYKIKKVNLVPGTCQFDINGVLAGGTTFPNGEATVGTDEINVSTTGVDYDVTFDFSTYEYSFKIATFPSIAIVGSGAAGWPPSPQPEGYVDPNQMQTTDGIIYTLDIEKAIALKAVNPEVAGSGEIKFRTDSNWDKANFGGTAFPIGTTSNDNIKVTKTGAYRVVLNLDTKEYVFTEITYSIVGEGVGGWPPSPQPEGYVDPNQLSTVDGINYTINNLVCVGGGAKFRLNNNWAGGDWGGATFPAGTGKSSDNIPTVAGTYNLTMNRVTGDYDFGTALGVKNFTIAGLKAYPNPTKNNWNFTANEEITSVQVFDILGKSVYNKTTSSKEVNVNASKLSKGVYFAKLSTEKGSSTVKLVKE